MNWWTRLRRQSDLEAQLDREMRFHIEEHAADLMARGVPEAEARRGARVAMGGVEVVKEECRDARGTRWAEELWQDTHYALRLFRQKPGFTAVTLATLALGIGATTVMFTVIHGVLLKPLPYPEPDRLVAVHGRSATWNTALYGEQNVALPDFRDLQSGSRLVELAGWLFNGGTLSEPGNPEWVLQYEVSAGMLPILGMKPLRGRVFLPEEDRLSATPVALIGHGLWQHQFGGRPDAVGQSIMLDAKRYLVIGIAPADFRLDDSEADVFTLLGQDPTFQQNRRVHPVGVIGRLRPGTSLQQAATELAAIGRSLAEKYPATNKDRAFSVNRLHPEVGNVGSTLWLLLGAVTVVLLIACANVANLLLARAVSRERELATRVALGASHWRLARQCLTESAVLGIAGGTLGVALATIGIRPFVSVWPGSLPRAEEVALDWRVLLAALAVSVASGLLFGIAPALRVPMDLKNTARGVVAGVRRMHAAFVVSEIALALVLLVAAGMLGRTLVRLAALDPGVNVHNVLVTRMALSQATLVDPARTRLTWKDALDRARSLPGVEAIAMVDTVPMRRGNNMVDYWTNAAMPPQNQRLIALATSVTPDYLKVMGIHLQEGRFFDNRDRLDSNPVIVIDDVLARSAFSGRPAAGQRLWVPDMGGPIEVVGVVGHVRHWGLAGDDGAQIRAQIYYPFAQVPDRLVHRWSDLMSIAVRTSVDPLSLVEALKREMRGATGDQVLYEVRTMERLAAGSLSTQRFLVVLFAVFAAVALLLACIGIYGVLSYLTGRRVPEIGMRMALGATAGDVVRMVLRQSAAMLIVGVGVGLAAGVGAEQLLLKLVEGMKPAEPVTFAVTTAVLAAAALAASFLPARRASHVDPMRALREE
jgi:putative ABC transport system permease protein